LRSGGPIIQVPLEPVSVSSRAFADLRCEVSVQDFITKPFSVWCWFATIYEIRCITALREQVHIQLIASIFLIGPKVCCMLVPPRPAEAIGVSRIFGAEEPVHMILSGFFVIPSRVTQYDMSSCLGLYVTYQFPFESSGWNRTTRNRVLPRVTRSSCGLSPCSKPI